MTRKGFIVVAMATAGFMLWCTRSSNPVEPERGERTAVSAKESNRDVRDTKQARTEPQPRRIPSSARPSRPSLSVERVDFDRRPWDPSKELDTVYERRASVAEAFDRFCEEADISDEKARQIMLILYDYQENKRLIFEDVMKDSLELEDWEFKLRMRQAALPMYLAGVEGHDRLAALLTPEEMRAWERIVWPSQIWYKLTIQPLIGPVPNG